MRPLARQARHLGRKLTTRTGKIVLGVLVLLIGLRIAAPHVVKWAINDRLSKLDGYWGHVEDVDLALWRGAYRLEGIRVVKTGEDVPVPFFRAPKIEISVEWEALFEGPAVVAEIDLFEPELNFVAGPGEEMAQSGEEADWRQAVNDIVPITINRVTVRDGQVHYRDFASDPPVNLYVQNLHATARNLSTIHREEERLPARVDVRGLVQASGGLEAHARLDPWSEQPTFDLDLAVRNLDVRELNPFLGAYVGVDAEAGRFFLYSQIDARDGGFEGWVKPMAEGLSIFRPGEDGDFFDVLGDALVGLVVEVFENHPNDRFGTRVPVSGSFDQPDVDAWAAVWGVLKNAFIEALRHGIQGDGWSSEGEDDETREQRAERLRNAQAEREERQREQREQRAEERRERRERAREEAEERREQAEERREEAAERRREAREREQQRQAERRATR